MNNTTTIKWDNAKLNDEFLRINQDGSFKVKENAPLMFVIGELVHAFLKQREQIKQLEEALVPFAQIGDIENDSDSTL
jgi:hypothetical protein